MLPWIKILFDKIKALKRDLKPFVDRSAALKTEVQVDDRGQVFLNATNNGETDINRTQNLNSSDILNSEEIPLIQMNLTNLQH